MKPPRNAIRVERDETELSYVEADWAIHRDNNPIIVSHGPSGILFAILPDEQAPEELLGPYAVPIGSFQDELDFPADEETISLGKTAIVLYMLDLEEHSDLYEPVDES